MIQLLARHGPDDLVGFGIDGARDAAQLAAHVRAIADRLPDGVAGDRVVLACADRYHFSAGLLACWLRGYVAELPANGQPATLQALEAGSATLAVLHDRPGPHGIDVSALEVPTARAALPITLAQGYDDLAVIAYTSGSTGAPTPHAKTFGQLVREPEAHVAAFGLAGRRVVAAVPPYHIYGLLFGVLVPLVGGGSMSRGSPLLPAELLTEIARHRAEVLVAVPPHLSALAAHDAPAWPRLVRVFSSAAPLPAETSRALSGRGLTVTEVLGSTETGGIATRTAADQGWTPLPGVRCMVDEEGGLCVDAPWLPPDASRPVRTADRVAFEGERFRHLGRSDAVVKVGGRRIDLGELETRLAGVDGVREARVLARESHGMRGVELVAVVAAEPHVDAASLRAALAQHVDPVAVPRRYRIVEALPRSSTGKVTRAALLALFDTKQFPREECAGQVQFAVPHDSAYFRGHFDGQPILPGVVQLSQLALREARRRYPELGPLVRLTRVKFKRLVGPGEVLALSLERLGAHVVHFTLASDGQPTASGRLHFREGGP